MDGCLEQATSALRKYLIWDPYLRYSTKITPKWCTYWFCVVFSLLVELIYTLGQIGYLITTSSLEKFAQCFGTFAIVMYLNMSNFLVIHQQKSWSDLIEHIEEVANELFYHGASAQKEFLMQTSKRYQSLGRTIQWATLMMGSTYLSFPALYSLISQPDQPPNLTLVYVPFEMDNLWKKCIVYFTIVFGILHNVLFYAYFTGFISSVLLFVNLCFLGLCENVRAVAITSDEHESNIKVIQNIKIHQKLSRLCTELESVMNDIMLLRVLSALISSSCLGLLVFIDIKANLRFLILPTHEMTQLLIFCWAGNLIMNQSGRIPDAVYFMPWMKAKKSTRTLLLILMTRCNRNIRLTAGKFCGLTLKTFIGVLKTSISYLTVLRNLHNKRKI